MDSEYDKKKHTPSLHEWNYEEINKNVINVLK